jgi:hypothetical protein
MGGLHKTCARATSNAYVSHALSFGLRAGVSEGCSFFDLFYTEHAATYWLLLLGIEDSEREHFVEEMV